MAHTLIPATWEVKIWRIVVCGQQAKNYWDPTSINKLGVVEHACDPSCARGLGYEDCGLPAGPGKSMRPWMNEWMNERMNQPTNQWTNEWKMGWSMPATLSSNPTTAKKKKKRNVDLLLELALCACVGAQGNNSHNLSPSVNSFM
jgi:hypothetical protein